MEQLNSLDYGTHDPEFMPDGQKTFSQVLVASQCSSLMAAIDNYRMFGVGGYADWRPVEC